MTNRVWFMTNYPSGWEKTNLRFQKKSSVKKFYWWKKRVAFINSGPILFGRVQGDFLFQSFEGGKQSVTVGIAALKPTWTVWGEGTACMKHSGVIEDQECSGVQSESDLEFRVFNHFHQSSVGAQIFLNFFVWNIGQWRGWSVVESDTCQFSIRFQFNDRSFTF